MSYTPSELRGICGMMPAFATDDASDITATNTVNVDALHAALDRIIKDDGVNLIATTGTFGQVWNLLPHEWETLVTASLEAVNKRVPLMLGVTSPNPREVVQKMKFVRQQGGEGVLLGLPYYDSLPIKDIATFYRQVAEQFPDLSIMIYHNPKNHRVHIPVAVFPELLKIPNIVAMKDSHRDTREFLKLNPMIRGKISHFVNQVQLYPYYEMGAQGCWSHAIWSGPWPVIALREAVFAGDSEKAKSIIADLMGGGDGEGRRGHAHHEFGDYVQFGPPRPPFSFGLATEEDREHSEQRMRKAAARWKALCDKYRPEVEARQLAGAAVS
jgi:dihydrodipicolinate synthase/N-acetylneuraminate lyase